MKFLTEEYLKENVSWGYFSKFKDISDKYMPDRGEGETMASQAVTATNKLIYKWYNDGDVYDNSYFLEGWANDLSTYANWLFNRVGCAFLADIEKAYGETEYEQILKTLADTVLNEEFLAKYTNRLAISSIYEEDGPFKFVEQSDDDFDDYDYNEEDDGYYDWDEEEG